MTTTKHKPDTDAEIAEIDNWFSNLMIVGKSVAQRSTATRYIYKLLRAYHRQAERIRELEAERDELRKICAGLLENDID